MAKGNNTPVFVPVLQPDSGQCAIKYDHHLGALLNAEGIDDPHEKMVVLDVLCALGLARHRIFEDDTPGSQEHEYTSTKAMRKLAKEWLYSSKYLVDLPY